MFAGAGGLGCICESVIPSVRLFVCLSACMFVLPNICLHMRTFINACATFPISTDGRTDRRTEGGTDGRTQIYASRRRACKHKKVCIDEHTHERLNIWTHRHRRRQTDRQTDRRTDSHIRPNARASTFTRTYDALRYIRTDG